MFYLFIDTATLTELKTIKERNTYLTRFPDQLGNEINLFELFPNDAWTIADELHQEKEELIIELDQADAVTIWQHNNRYLLWHYDSGVLWTARNNNPKPWKPTTREKINMIKRR